MSRQIKLSQPVRCIVSIPSKMHRFLVATCSPNANAFHLLDYDEEATDAITHHKEIPQEHEVWTTAVHQDLLFAGGPRTLKVYHIEEECFREKGVLTRPTKVVVCARDEIAAVGKQDVALLDANLQVSSSLDVSANAMQFDPHHTHRLATCDASSLKLWDVRSGQTGTCEAHIGAALSLDFNPNVPYQLVTSGEDAKLRIWDARNLSQCIKELADSHKHWIAKVCFNQVHDQLLLSAGTDSKLNLWRVVSVTSQPIGSESKPSVTDGVIKTFDHEEAIYSCAWSCADSWVFASVSYDGLVMINQVPSEEKYRILL